MTRRADGRRCINRASRPSSPAQPDGRRRAGTAARSRRSNRDGTKVFELWAEPRSGGRSSQGRDRRRHGVQRAGPRAARSACGRATGSGSSSQNQLDEPTDASLPWHDRAEQRGRRALRHAGSRSMPGGSWTYKFTVQDPPGFYVYHSHFNSTEQVGRGLYGALIVLPDEGDLVLPVVHDGSSGPPEDGSPVIVDREFTMFLGDGPLGYTLNGKSFPATLPPHRRAGRLGATPLRERRLDVAPDAPPRVPLRGRRAGRVPARPRRYLADTLVDRAGAAVRRPWSQADVPGSLGLPLPHPSRTSRDPRACSGW